VAPPTPTQLAWRGRIEAVLRIAGPALDLLLLAGDRLSRTAAREQLVPPARRRTMASTPGARRVGPGTGSAPSGAGS
jgi:hypothetical protein